MSAGYNSVLVLSREEIDRSLIRISHEIVEKNHGVKNLVLMGIPTRGKYLAERIAATICGFEEMVPCGTLDITMFRDDLRLRAPRAIAPTLIPEGGISGKDVVLVDDVLFSGRTIRSALDALNEIGRPRSVQLAVLVDRGHRQLPIRADFVGKNLPTSLEEKVQVHLEEIDEDSSVYVVKGAVV
jgi:pyrimidine operon attenuation protein/uracil phosphoribosyltransferase